MTQATTMDTPVDLVQRLKDSFAGHFGESAEAILQAPGRVNLIGEHTDYNDGFVLPAAINYYTAIACSPRRDRIIEAVAVDQGNSVVQIHLDEPQALSQTAPWSNYLRGMIQTLKAFGLQLSGANLAIAGNVPVGAGLSSSASLEMAIARALVHLSGEALTGQEAARIGQAAENDFVGCQCGIMDQLISALGEPHSALLLDCRSLATQTVPMPEDLALVIVNSGVKRGLVDSEYNTRRLQCEQVAQQLSVPALRDLTLSQLKAAQNRLDPVAFRRARHVITENQRTLDAAEALRAGDLKQLSLLMAESHASMRDDFEITVPAIDTLVEIIGSVIGQQGGTRMTGGGFGGCVVALVPKALQSQVIETVQKQYPQATGYQPEIFVCEASQGAFVSSL